MPLQINVAYSAGFPLAAQQAVNRAVASWSALLNSPVPVTIEAYWDVMLPGLTAMCVPTGFENFVNAPQQNTWYMSALADRIAGVDLAPGVADMKIFFNSAPGWFSSSPGQCPADKYDLETTALHEMGHGFGFVGLFWVVAATGQGSYGSQMLIGALPGYLPVQGYLPNLNNHPSAFGRLLQTANGGLLVNLPNNSVALGTALCSGAVSIALPGGPRAIYAPANFEPFSSEDHFVANSLMVPSFGLGVMVRAVDQATLDALALMGW